MNSSASYESPFDYARKRPVELLAGLFTGTLSTLFTFGFLWFFAPVFPLIICEATIVFRRTTAFSMGAFAAFFGVFTFVALFSVLYWI